MADYFKDWRKAKSWHLPYFRVLEWLAKIVAKTLNDGLQQLSQQQEAEVNACEQLRKDWSDLRHQLEGTNESIRTCDFEQGQARLQEFESSVQSSLIYGECQKKNAHGLSSGLVDKACLELSQVKTKICDDNSAFPLSLALEAFYDLVPKVLKEANTVMSLQEVKAAVIYLNDRQHTGPEKLIEQCSLFAPGAPDAATALTVEHCESVAEYLTTQSEAYGDAAFKKSRQTKQFQSLTKTIIRDTLKTMSKHFQLQAIEERKMNRAKRPSSTNSEVLESRFVDAPAPEEASSQCTSQLAKACSIIRSKLTAGAPSEYRTGVEELLTVLSAYSEVVVPNVQDLLSEEMRGEKPSAEALSDLRTAEEAQYRLDMEGLSEADAADRNARYASFMKSFDAIKSVMDSELDMNPSCRTSVQSLRELVESHQRAVQGSKGSNVC
ncbi:hypothetical protein QFC24_006349 [Naganishia onofrii]|uniref:Uncharacterized protein n=1 Tax=Naganishia onofrii TaxID=1851511 RepID=A0ACC2X450_9TREE|nr:hypothetical protein QFC24_006349 [Naganishia onofrii]